MGLFDHLFKSKSPSSEEDSVETGAKSAEPAKRPDDAARSSPPHRADPSAFLHPKSFVPRGVSPLAAPAKSGAHSGVRKLGTTSAPPAPDEIVLTLGDVLSRIPTPYLKPGQHDVKREMRFSINDLSSDIARGRAAVPLSRIAQLMPDIFVKSISRDEDTEIRLPLQKLVEQIGLLRARPPVTDRTSRVSSLPSVVQLSVPLPPPELKMEPVVSAAETLEPVKESVLDLLRPSEPILFVQPSESADSFIPEDEEQPLEFKPEAAESFVPMFFAAPEVPVADTPPSKEPELLTPPAAPAIEFIAPVAVAAATIPAFVETPLPPEEEARPEVLTPLPVAGFDASRLESISPPPVETPAPAASEPILANPAPLPVVERVVREPMDAEVGDEKIQLGLAAILRQCPPEIIVGELPVVPDNIRITLPFAPIDRQLVYGHVEISAVRFVAALPFSYQKYFSARIGVKVPIPLEEVFQNLPSPATDLLADSGPPPQFLAPAAPSPIPEEEVDLLPVPEADFTVPVEDQSLASAIPEAVPAIAPDGPGAPPALPETIPVVTPVLDLPAFSHFMPPPPILHPEKLEQSPVAAMGMPEATIPVAAPVLPVMEVVSDERLVGEVAVETVPQIDPVLSQLPVEVPLVTEQTLAASPQTPQSAGDEIPASLETSVVADLPATTEETVVAPTPVPAAEAVIAPLNQAHAPTVFDEPTKTILPPQMVRPFIVLPPPIFGFTLTPVEPESESDKIGQSSEDESTAAEFTLESELNRPPLSEVEATAQATPLKPVEEHSRIVPGESLAGDIVSGAPVSTALPGIITIDFAQALVTPDESVIANAGPVVEAADLPPPTPGESLPTEVPVSEAPVVSEPVADTPKVRTIEIVVHLADRIQSAIPSEVPFGAITRMVEEPPALLPQDEPPSFPQDKPASLPQDEPAIDESALVEPTVLVDEPAAPSADQPPMFAPEPTPVSLGEERVEAPMFTADPVLEPGLVAAFAPVVETPSVVETPVVLEAALAEAAAPEPPAEEEETVLPLPLLTLPKISYEPFQAEVLPPPALPLRRFNQDALQAIFMTEENLDLAKISRMAAVLPGIHACVIATRDQACTGGTLPDGFDLAALLGLAPRVGEAAGRLPIGGLKHFTLYGEQYSVSFFERNGLSLCAVHRPRSFVPGVREKLVAIADELSRS